jgi:hypothetical protein
MSGSELFDAGNMSTYGSSIKIWSIFADKYCGSMKGIWIKDCYSAGR